MCDAFSAFAQAYGHGFHPYASLDHAIECARPGAADVLIADMHLADEVRRFMAWLDTLPVEPRAIILTSSAPGLVRHILGPDSMIAVMRKPVDMNELRELLA